jgi:hypothetical protein
MVTVTKIKFIFPTDNGTPVAQSTDNKFTNSPIPVRSYFTSDYVVKYKCSHSPIMSKLYLNIHVF